MFQSILFKLTKQNDSFIQTNNLQKFLKNNTNKFFDNHSIQNQITKTSQIFEIFNKFNPLQRKFASQWQKESLHQNYLSLFSDHLLKKKNPLQGKTSSLNRTNNNSLPYNNIIPSKVAPQSNPFSQILQSRFILETKKQPIPNRFQPSSGSKRMSFFSIFPVLGLFGVLVYTYDQIYADQIALRTFRAFSAAGKIWYLYKFKYDTKNSIEENSKIHKQAAEAILETCSKNGGLFIKIGQGIITMSHILPVEYTSTLIQLQDKAPTIPFETVEKILKKELRKDISEVFLKFDEKPIASASIAQVHKAILRSGEVVAVKVQKPEIRPQFPWDMWTYGILLRLLEWRFELPMSWTVPFTALNLKKETDFINEAKNSERAAKDLAIFGSQVHVPKIYWNQTTSQIMTTEWIDGIKMNDSKRLKTIGVYQMDDLLTLMVKVFAFQIFKAGFVHADPHFGNLFVRQNNFGQLQLVILDHGLYIEETEGFRLNYCKLWKSIFTMDKEAIYEICKDWGIAEPELFASLTMMRPFDSKNRTAITQNKSYTPEQIKEFQEKANQSIRNLLKNTSLIPLELIFVGRNINIVRSNNKLLGAPINRIGIMAEYANSTVNEHLQMQSNSMKMNWIDSANLMAKNWIFSGQIFVLSFFYRIMNWFNKIVSLTGKAPVEDPLEKQIDQMEQMTSDSLRGSL